MMDPLISVIVPAYNAAKWIEDCCQSVISQTYKNWELIVINDGSRDRTAEIVERMACDNARIRLISTENHGVCHARNVGLDAAKGELITFLDADDTLQENALEEMYGLLSADRCEIAIMAKAYLKPGEIFLAKNTSSLTEIWENGQVLEKSLEDHPASHSVYAKLYQRELIGDTRFVEGKRVHEDSFFVFQCFAKCKRAVYQNRSVYLYYVIPGSVSRASFSEKYFDILYFAQEKARILQENFPKYSSSIGDIMMRANLALLYNMCKTYKKEYRLRQKECIRYIRMNRKTFAPVTRFEKRCLNLVRLRVFWLYKFYLYIRLMKLK